MDTKPGEERPLIFSFLFVWRSLYLSSTVLLSLQKVVNKTFLFSAKKENCVPQQRTYTTTAVPCNQATSDQPSKHTHTQTFPSLPLYITLYNICPPFSRSTNTQCTDETFRQRQRISHRHDKTLPVFFCT